jgi:hypothetical protein
VADILTQIGTKVGGELKNLDTRLTSAETEIVALGGQTPPPTGSFTISPIVWTNLTEINLSGEKAQNISFDPPPLGLGVEVEVLASWTNGGKTASVGEIYEIVLVQDTGGMKLTGNGQSLFASANQMATQVRALHPGEGQAVETITEFTFDLVGREIRSLISNANRNMVAGEITTITQYNSSSGVLHSGGDGTKEIRINQQGTGWELLSEEIRKPYLWTVHSGTIDQDELVQGNIKGSGGAVGVEQVFNTPLSVGTKIVVKAERIDTNTGSVSFKHLKLDGNTQGGDILIPRDDGFVEYEVTTSDMYGIRFSTQHGLRGISSISVFQGVVSGGSVQANGNGGIEKISGTGGFNAGASSTNFIEGNSNGYVQFQWGSANKSQQIGLTYLDDDYGHVEPFRMNINGNGHVFTNGSNIFEGGAGWATQGDYFRIRHYASDNTIRFQKRENIYNSITLDFVNLEQNSGSNHVFEEADRPYIRAVSNEDIFVEGTIYRMYESSTSILRGRIYTLDGTDLGFSNAGTKWEVVEFLGADYVTFHTHSELTNGNNLYVDTTLFHVGSRFNDALLAR